MLRIFKGIICLFFLDSVICTVNQRMLQDYISSELGISIQSQTRIEKFYDETTDKIYVKIQDGNKTYDIALKNAKDGGFQTLYLEKVSSFGSGNSYLNIRTTRGDKEVVGQKRNNANLKKVQGQGVEISVLQMIKSILLDQFPLAEAQSIKLQQFNQIWEQMKVSFKMLGGQYCAQFNKKDGKLNLARLTQEQ